MVLGQEENVTFPSFFQRLLELLGKRKQGEWSNFQNFLFMLYKTLRLYNKTYMSKRKIIFVSFSQTSAGREVLYKFLGGDVPLGPWNREPIPELV